MSFSFDSCNLVQFSALSLDFDFGKFLLCRRKVLANWSAADKHSFPRAFKSKCLQQILDDSKIFVYD